VSIIETSKILLGFASIISLIVLIFSGIIMFKFETYEPLCYIVPSVFTECAAATGFYYNKAKHENKIKIVLGAIKEIS
jgi:hypothetical protein